MNLGPLSSSPRRLAASIATVVVIADATSKAIVAHALAGRGIVNVLGGVFHLELYRNHAGPGGLFHGHPVLVTLLSSVAVLGLGVVAWSVRSQRYGVGLGLLLGGGLGNLVDRFANAPGPLRGGVVDWIKPTLTSGSLNLADLAINLGVIAVIVAVVLEWWSDPREHAAPRASTS